MDEAGCKDSLGTVNVLGAVDEDGKCTVQVEELGEVGVAGLLLGHDCESATNGCSYSHQLLEAADGESIDSVEG